MQDDPKNFENKVIKHTQLKMYMVMAAPTLLLIISPWRHSPLRASAYQPNAGLRKVYKIGNV